MTDQDPDPVPDPDAPSDSGEPADRGESADRDADPDAAAGADDERASTDGAVPAWLPDPVLAYRLEGGDPVVVSASRRFERTFGIGDAAGRPLAAVLSAAVDEDGAVVDAAGAGRRHESVVAPGGEYADGYLVRVVPPPASDAGTGHLVFTDVSDLQRQIAGLEAERDRLSQFASVVAHDVQNPIGTARLRLQSAREEPEDVHFEKALSAIDRMESILEDAVRLVREGQIVDECEPVDLADAAEVAWETVEGADVTLAVEEDLPTVAADPGPLRELLENLFHNAVEHGGADVTVAARPDGFAVVDDGPGIPPGEREAVFDPGYSGNEGTGLGLAIVERIAADHGWTVAAADAPDGGCEVRVTGVDRDP